MSGKIKIKKEKEPKATSAVFIDVDLLNNSRTSSLKQGCLSASWLKCLSLTVSKTTK